MCEGLKSESGLFGEPLSGALATIKTRKVEVSEQAAAVAAEVLQRNQEALKAIGLGGAEGRSWKEGLGKSASFKDLVAAAQHLTSEAFGKKLFAAHSKAHKDSGLASLCRQNVPQKIQTPIPVSLSLCLALSLSLSLSLCLR